MLGKTRNSRPEVCCEKGVLKNLAIFDGKYLCWTLPACSFIKKRLQHSCFLVNIAKFLKTPILGSICERLFPKKELYTDVDVYDYDYPDVFRIMINGFDNCFVFLLFCENLLVKSVIFTKDACWTKSVKKSQLIGTFLVNLYPWHCIFEVFLNSSRQLQ